MRVSLDLLQRLRAAFPDLVPCLLLDKESDTKVVVQLCDQVAHKVYGYTLDATDLSREPEDIAREIAGMHASHPAHAEKAAPH